MMGVLLEKQPCVSALVGIIDFEPTLLPIDEKGQLVIRCHKRFPSDHLDDQLEGYPFLPSIDSHECHPLDALINRRVLGVKFLESVLD